jgi:hypothetical protein
MGRKNHGHCSHALKEDAPKLLGHDSISKWNVVATERRTPWSGGGYLRNGGNKILPRNLMLSTKELKWGLQLIYLEEP